MNVVYPAAKQNKNRDDWAKWFIRPNEAISGAQEMIFNRVRNRLNLDPDVIEFRTGGIAHKWITGAYEIKTIQENITLSKTIIDCNGRILLHEEYFSNSNKNKDVRDVFGDIFPVLEYISMNEQDAAKDFPSIGKNDSTFEINADAKDEETQDLIRNWVNSSLDEVIEDTKGGAYI